MALAHSPKRSRFVAFVLAMFAPVACSSASHPPSSNNTGAPPPVPPAPAEADCSGDNSIPAPGATCITVVRGQLLNSEDKPLNVPLALCGGGVLCQGAAADEGIFAVEVNRVLDLSTFVIHVYGHPSYSDLIIPLERATTREVKLGTLPRVPRLVDTGPPFPDTTVGELVIRTGPVELTLQPGTTTYVLPGHLDTQEFRVGPVPNATAYDPTLVALYAMGPFGAYFSAKAGVALTLPASAGIAEGATVELVVLSDALVEGTAGRFNAIGKATVTGGIARGLPGVGIDRVTWIGVRK